MKKSSTCLNSAIWEPMSSYWAIRLLCPQSCLTMVWMLYRAQKWRTPIGYNIIVFFEAYKRQHYLISPSTAMIRINVAGKILGIDTHTSGINFISTVLKSAGMG